VIIADGHGHVLERRRLSRRPFERFIDTLTPTHVVVLEACSTAHYWGRRCQTRGATVRLLPAQYVRPYVRRNKTDRTDAEALLEANRCGALQPVPIKTPEQQAIQGLHRVRTQWLRTRTARINVMRGLLREHGIALPVGTGRMASRVVAALEQHASELPALVPQLAQWLLADLHRIDEQLRVINQQVARLARTHPVAVRLQQVPAVGPVTATALVGTVTHIHRFARGRQFASWMGLTPREMSSGHRRELGGISKRGDRYLRTLLCHGARALLRAAQVRQQRLRSLTPLQQWGLQVLHRRGHNRAVVALANKLARIIWAVWRQESDGALVEAVS